MKDKRVLVTAGAAGIGRAIVQAFADAGAKVHVCDLNGAALAELRDQEPGVTTSEGDIGNRGAVERMAIFALNVMPYISASIIVQILSTAVPSLERLKKEGEGGRKQLNQYTRYLTVVLAVVQSFGIAVGLWLAIAAVTGFLLLIKKDYAWIQPPTARGAAAAAGYGPLHIGTDIGGSLRLPAGWAAVEEPADSAGAPRMVYVP